MWVVKKSVKPIKLDGSVKMENSTLQCHFFTSEKKAIDALNCEAKVLDDLNDNLPLDYENLRLTKKYSSITDQCATTVWIEEVTDQTVWTIDTGTETHTDVTPVIFHADL